MRRIVADVVVVGAGVIGCSAAFHLARMNGTRVVVVEKGSLGSGMTKRSGGMVRASFSDESEAQLASVSLRYYREWKERVGGTCGFATTGLVTVAGPGVDASSARETASVMQNVGSAVQILPPDALKQLAPTAVVDDLELVVYEPDAGFVDPSAGTAAFASQAKDLGASFQTGALAKGILVERNRVFGVDTTIGTIETLAVVVAAGPWSDRLLKPLGIEIGIRPELTQVAFFERPPELKQGHLAYRDLVTGAYFRPHTYGLSQSGLIQSDAMTVANPDRFDETVAPEFATDVRARMARRVPSFESARFIRGHTGVYDVSPDMRPVLGPAERIHGLFIAAGFSGNGFCFAPAAGACIAEMVTENSATTANVSTLDLSRFQNPR